MKLTGGSGHRRADPAATAAYLHRMSQPTVVRVARGCALMVEGKRYGGGEEVVVERGDAERFEQRGSARIVPADFVRVG